MIEQNSRPARKVGIADHLWDTYEEMAQQMGSDRDALINQALFMFARLNGFIEVGRVTRVESPVAVAHAAEDEEPAEAPAPRPVPSAHALTPAPAALPASRPSAPPVLTTVPGGPGRPAPPMLREEPAPVPAPARPSRSSTMMEERAPANALDDDPVRREVAERVLETAAELERLIKGRNEAPPAEELLQEEEEPLPEAADPHGLDDGMDDLPPEQDEQDEHAEPPPDEEMDAVDEGLALCIVTEAGDEEPIVKERFIIGRGKHCDFVINSGKVSREHAAIFREGADWFIEDLGSSNGTWFNKQRIKRRQVEDGDEYFICSEKVKLVFR